jgi:N utilization substance protein A
MITRALNPARVNSVVLNEEEHTAEVYLDPDQVSLAIGKGGLNVKLASMLVGYTIDVFRELDSEEDNDDVSLDEFTDAIEPWIIDELKKIGFQTAKGVLGAQREMIIQNADLEEETVDEVLRILQAEFE